MHLNPLLLIFISSSPTSLHEERCSLQLLLLLSLFLLLEGNSQSKAHARPPSLALGLALLPSWKQSKRTLTLTYHPVLLPISTDEQQVVQQRWYQASAASFPCRGTRLAQQGPTLYSASSPSCSWGMVQPLVTCESLACLLFVNSNIVPNTIDWLWELNGKDTVFWSWSINLVHICHRSISCAFKHCLVSQPKAFCKCNLSHGGKTQKA